ncbi:hypothetical protein SAMN05216190_10327 [Pseudomonas borbori]|uniref:Uncharacterized protein n=1 Tax=Pseudomonas borbori TaxID=289003 RepID=A0A1I5LED3_9PSED|nr:hypothetical protein SAMN05216190_10327 [Pseudomonas borbori]
MAAKLPAPPPFAGRELGVPPLLQRGGVDAAKHLPSCNA